MVNNLVSPNTQLALLRSTEELACNHFNAVNRKLT